MLTNAPFEYLSLELPPEALHYGADVTGATVSKSIKYAGKTVSKIVNKGPEPVNTDKTASEEEIDIIHLEFADKEGIVKVDALADEIKKTLEGSDDVDQDDKNTLANQGFASARFSRFMLEGEPKVEFSLGGNH